MPTQTFIKHRKIEQDIFKKNLCRNSMLLEQCPSGNVKIMSVGKGKGKKRSQVLLHRHEGHNQCFLEDQSFLFFRIVYHSTRRKTKV